MIRPRFVSFREANRFFWPVDGTFSIVNLVESWSSSCSHSSSLYSLPEWDTDKTALSVSILRREVIAKAWLTCVDHSQWVWLWRVAVAMLLVYCGKHHCAQTQAATLIGLTYCNFTCVYVANMQTSLSPDHRNTFCVHQQGDRNTNVSGKLTEIYGASLHVINYGN